MSVYEDIAEAYDLLYRSAGKNYEAEAAAVGDVVIRRCPTARRLLDVACGTGRHLAALQHRFEVEGLDVSQSMLERARMLNPSLPLHLGDMRSFRLSTSFDAVVCLFSSIGNLYPRSEMEVAVANMAGHLVPGGVLVVEPWLTPSTADTWALRADAAASADLAVARTARSWTEDSGRKLCVDMQWLVAQASGTTNTIEHHEMGLYDVAEYEAALRNAGVEPEYDAVGLSGRGLFVGVRKDVR